MSRKPFSWRWVTALVRLFDVFLPRCTSLALLLLIAPALANAGEQSPPTPPTPLAPAALVDARQVPPLLAALRDARAVGLAPADYGADILTARWSALQADAPLTTQREALARRWEQDFRRALRLYVEHLHFGRVDPADLGHGLRIDRSRLNLDECVTQLLASSQVNADLAALEPEFEHYRLLKAALARYRLLAADPALTALPRLPHRTLREGESWAGLPALAHLLEVLGDRNPLDAAGEPTYSTTLMSAVRHFQERHGLEPDGILGPATWRELTTPLSARVRTMELTLERWRWVPPHLHAAPLVINIPEFRLFAWETERDTEDRLLKFEVIVGEPYLSKHTPVFAGDLRYLVFRPYWDVPYRIAVRELLPKIAADAGYLQRERLQVVRGHGNDTQVLTPTAQHLAAIRRGTARLRQTPGEHNALGLVKFMLPNPYNVYLHSTPALSLFQRAARAFSHGCVRVNDAATLAAFILRHEPGWSQATVDAAMAEGAPESRIVKLTTPVRVYFVYATAMASREGIRFFADVYHHDAELAARLQEHRYAHWGHD